MEDDPSTATRRKKDSSMAVALNLLKEGRGDAVVSAGSTGALLTGATLTVKRIRGIRRAAFGAGHPQRRQGRHAHRLRRERGVHQRVPAAVRLHGQLLLPSTSSAARTRGSACSTTARRRPRARSCKSRPGRLLKRVSDEGRINFIGNVEGSAALSGDVDVIVTDGFTGNIMLKSCEGMIKFLMGQLKGVFLSSTKNKLAALMLKGDFKRLKDMMDVNKVGGTALLGISKPVIKAHGSSNDEAIFSAIRQAVQFARAGVIEEIEKNIDYMRLPAGAVKTEE